MNDVPARIKGRGAASNPVGRFEATRAEVEDDGVQLKSPKLPLVRMKPPAWAVIARLAWHAGHHGGIEDFRDAKERADKAVDMLSETALADGIAVLVAHGYFNAIVGRTLKKRGWRRYGGRDRAKFWNAVVYELPTVR